MGRWMDVGQIYGLKVRWMQIGRWMEDGYRLDGQMDGCRLMDANFEDGYRWMQMDGDGCRVDGWIYIQLTLSSVYIFDLQLPEQNFVSKWS